MGNGFHIGSQNARCARWQVPCSLRGSGFGRIRIRPRVREGGRHHVGSTGLGLLLEEHRAEIAGAWRQAVGQELGAKEPALDFAVAPLLRELALALGAGGERCRSREAWTRCAVMVRSTAAPAQLAREVKLLHRWAREALRARDVPV